MVEKEKDCHEEEEEEADEIMKFDREADSTTS